MRNSAKKKKKKQRKKHTNFSFVHFYPIIILLYAVMLYICICVMLYISIFFSFAFSFLVVFRPTFVTVTGWWPLFMYFCRWDPDLQTFASTLAWLKTGPYIAIFMYTRTFLEGIVSIISTPFPFAAFGSLSFVSLRPNGTKKKKENEVKSLTKFATVDA